MRSSMLMRASTSPWSMGLEMKSSAPASMPLVRSLRFCRLVIMTTGTWRRSGSSLICRHTS